MRQSRRNGGPSKLPRLLFTLDDVTMLKNALIPLELLLTTKPKSLPNIQFALETVTQVQKKVAQMVEQQIWGYEVSFDANEIVILHTAVWLFLAALEQLPGSPDKQEALRRCLALRSQLASIVAVAVRKT